MRRVVFACVLIAGCGPVRDPVPEPDYEGCSENHTSLFTTQNDVEIWVDGTKADRACNILSFHSRSEGQGAQVFHIEPVLRMNGDDPAFSSVTWDVHSMVDGTPSDLLASQGVEIWDDELVTEEMGVSHRSEIFIGIDARGKNLVLRAHLLDSKGGLTQVEAAVYLGSPAE